VLLTDVPGLLERAEDPRSLVSYIDLEGLRVMKQRGVLAGGMGPKAAAIESALNGGVARAHLVSWRVPDGLLAELFTNQGSGTLVVPELGTLTPDEQAAEPALP